MQIELFDARALAPLVNFLDRTGARSQSFLDRVRIPGELVETGGWVTKKQAYDFTFDVVQQLDRPDAVFAAYLDFELEHLGPIADAMRSCKTVKEALEVSARLANVAYEGSTYFLQSDGDTTWFCYRAPNVVSAGQTYINDMTLMIICQLVRMTAHEDWHPERMLIQREVIDRHRTVENFEDCQASLHPSYSALGFPTKFLSRRLPWKQETKEFNASDAWLFGPDGSEPIVDSLYRLVGSRFPYRKLPTLEQVAWMVDVSPATLKRQLRTAGMSFRRLTDRLRFDAACEMLAIPQMTEREIAHDLGYSGTNNFVRSFRRMTGVTPGQYRRQKVSGEA